MNIRVAKAGTYNNYPPMKLSFNASSRTQGQSRSRALVSALAPTPLRPLLLPREEISLEHKFQKISREAWTKRIRNLTAYQKIALYRLIMGEDAGIALPKKRDFSPLCLGKPQWRAIQKDAVRSLINILGIEASSDNDPVLIQEIQIALDNVLSSRHRLDLSIDTLPFDDPSFFNERHHLFFRSKAIEYVRESSEENPDNKIDFSQVSLIELAAALGNKILNYSETLTNLVNDQLIENHEVDFQQKVLELIDSTEQEARFRTRKVEHMLHTMVYGKVLAEGLLHNKIKAEPLLPNADIQCEFDRMNLTAAKVMNELAQSYIWGREEEIFQRGFPVESFSNDFQQYPLGINFEKIKVRDFQHRSLEDIKTIFEVLSKKASSVTIESEAILQIDLNTLEILSISISQISLMAGNYKTFIKDPFCKHRPSTKGFQRTQKREDIPEALKGTLKAAVIKQVNESFIGIDFQSDHYYRTLEEYYVNFFRSIHQIANRWEISLGERFKKSACEQIPNSLLRNKLFDYLWLGDFRIMKDLSLFSDLQKSSSKEVIEKLLLFSQEYLLNELKKEK
ncbi:MAG: hypothetical protein SFU25_06195 [Candidatus Caenarcaniphilales bacterium]|nr:hypothetical protein [Candidatus Caenarcaniphilales bacterium]